MRTTVEVFADMTCPFAHVGLKAVARHVAQQASPVSVRVRAWPLEWVNGSPLDADAVAVKAAALTAQLGVDDFAHFTVEAWPVSTIPALNLAGMAYGVDDATGFAVSLALASPPQAATNSDTCDLLMAAPRSMSSVARGSP